MKLYLEVKVENTFEVEAPDGLTAEEAYQYVLDNCQDEIGLAINGGDFYMEVLNVIDQTERRNSYGKKFNKPTIRLFKSNR